MGLLGGVVGGGVVFPALLSLLELVDRNRGELSELLYVAFFAALVGGAVGLVAGAIGGFLLGVTLPEAHNLVTAIVAVTLVAVSVVLLTLESAWRGVDTIELTEIAFAALPGLLAAAYTVFIVPRVRRRVLNSVGRPDQRS